VSAARRSASSTDRFKAAASSRRRDADTGQAPERGKTAKRSKPVRITVDLDPSDYRQMKRLVDTLADSTDIPTLAHSVMWRALLHLAANDEQLLDRVAEQIADDLD